MESPNPLNVLAVADTDRDNRSSSSAIHSLLSLTASLKNRGIYVTHVTYADIARAANHDDADTLIILFFPYSYWNSSIEGILPDPYGSLQYYQTLKRYLQQVESVLVDSFPAGRFLNSVDAILTTRDKIKTKFLLSQSAVPTPSWHPNCSSSQLAGLISREAKIYAKARCGSNSKGISVLTGESLHSNYVVDGSHLRPPQMSSTSSFTQSEQWEFNEILVDKDLVIDLLCDGNFLIEDAVPPDPLLGKVELKIGVAFDEVVSEEIRVASPTSLITNPTDRVVQLPPETGEKALRSARNSGLRAARALGLNYAVVDLLFDGETAFAVDVQAFPGLSTSPSDWKGILNAASRLAPP